MGPTRLRFPHSRLLVAVLLTIIGAGAFTTGATAQTTGETTTLTTYVRLCLEPGCTEDLELTEPVDGVAVEIADAATGDVLGACTTGELEAGACAADIATVESVTITLDETAIPEGYQATDNPGQLNLADSAEYPFLLQPVDGFPEEAETPPADDSGDEGVSELPSTGSGPGEDSTAIVLTASVLAAATLGLVALASREVAARRF